MTPFMAGPPRAARGFPWLTHRTLADTLYACGNCGDDLHGVDRERRRDEVRRNRPIMTLCWRCRGNDAA